MKYNGRAAVAAGVLLQSSGESAAGDARYFRYLTR